MPYERQNFKPKQTLTAACMNKIDEWLCHICGKEVVSGEVTPNGELVFTRCDKSTLNVGKVTSSGGGLNITDDGNGNVTITTSGGVSITDDGNGNVVIA
jgi:hypothetical protein